MSSRAAIIATTRNLRLAAIMWLIQAETGYTRAQLIGKKRKADLVAARHAAQGLILTCMPGMGLIPVAKVFGNRDHTSILHGKRRAIGVDGPVPANVLYKRLLPATQKMLEDIIEGRQLPDEFRIYRQSEPIDPALMTTRKRKNSPTSEPTSAEA